jgi:pimeloyl-ACP methyl ester carboxylesterase
MPYLDRAGTRIYYEVAGSPGGFLSLAFTLERPERVAGLVLCDTGPGFRSDQARQRWNDRAFATAARLERDGLAALGRLR